jgi:hypothetical protein
MHEFNQMEDTGHDSINGMIQKCAVLALQFHGEMDAEDEIDDDAPEDASDLDQEDPPDPWDAANSGPGDTGGDDGSEQGG